MRQIKCPNNHFYDADQYSQCPHCNSDNNTSGNTVPMNNVFTDKTEPMVTDVGWGKRTPTNTIPQSDEPTIPLYPSIGGENGPVVGWLVCIKGNHEGEAFTLRHGKNSIGRQATSATQKLSIDLSKDKTVSRGRQAIVIYEPHGNIFMVQSGDSQQLLYLNGNIVLAPTEIVKNDRLQLGDAELMLIPCCDAAFEWPSFSK